MTYHEFVSGKYKTQLVNFKVPDKWIPTPENTGVLKFLKHVKANPPKEEVGFGDLWDDVLFNTYCLVNLKLFTPVKILSNEQLSNVY